MTDAKLPEQQKSSKSKEINFDSDSDLPGLDNNEAAIKKEKKRAKGKKEKKDDLFGDDDDLPGISLKLLFSRHVYQTLQA